VTDANVVLGTIDPHDFAGWQHQARSRAPRARLERDVAEGLGLSTEMAAYAVYEMVSENMARPARVPCRRARRRGQPVQSHRLRRRRAAACRARRREDRRQARDRAAQRRRGLGGGFPAAPVSYELVRSRYMRLDSFDAAAAERAPGRDEREATRWWRPARAA
jgi:N-methylhydantoinase A